MEQSYDVVVIGSGVAGLSAALTSAPQARVAVVTKGALDDGCSRYAQGGIAAAVGADDSPELHYQDTIAAGRGLCDEKAVRVLVDSAPNVIRQLVDWGVHFDTHKGQLTLGQEAAHSRMRILHARGDATGLEIETALAARIRQQDCTIFEQHHVINLLLDDSGRCVGVEAKDKDGTPVRIAAKAVILATGGGSRLWSNSTNPDSATGDGIALAYSVGAEVASMEFVQFHPTALAIPGAPRFLISEAVRGEGAYVVNESGERFVFADDERGELAPRDIVSQSIWRELHKSGAKSVFLDCRPIADIAAVRFPSIYRTCKDWGIDMTHDLVPISPAAHYLIGGVRTDLSGDTNVPGLYAAGEVASTGVHGANRLASNSLLESLVFGQRAAEHAVSQLEDVKPSPVGAASELSKAVGIDDSVADLSRALRESLWAGAGVVRDSEGLQKTLQTIAQINDACRSNSSLSADALREASLTAQLVCDAAVARAESRGCHLRSDFPRTEEDWRGIFIQTQNKGVRLEHCNN